MAQQLADNDARVTALRDDVARSILEMRQAQRRSPSGTDGRAAAGRRAPPAGTPQSAFVDEIKRQLQSEMGLLPVRLLRERKRELRRAERLRQRSARPATARPAISGNGYFITVKHGVIALDEPAEGREPRRITSIKIRYKGKDLPARVVDSGDANVEVHPGDWAIIKVRGEIDLPPLQHRHVLRLRLRRADLPAGQRLLEGHHPQHRLRRAAHGQRPGHLPDRRPSGRVGRRRARTSTAISSASRSAGCRATTASRSSCRCAPRCSARCPACRAARDAGEPSSGVGD